jgi:hypothetical protein
MPILLLLRSDREGWKDNDGWITGPERAHPDGNGLKIIERNPVRVVPENALLRFVSPKTRAAVESSFGRISNDACELLSSLLGIAGAARDHDLGQAVEFAGRAAVKTGKLWPIVSVASLWDGVAAAINAGLSDKLRATPVVWQKTESQLMPALLCSDAAQALLAHALFTITGQRGLRVCQRCGNPFFAARGTHSFCTYRCRTANAMKGYRKKLKLAESRRKRERSKRRATERKRRNAA